MGDPRRRRRRGALAVAAPWALWAALRAAGAERGFPLVPAISFTPYAALSAVLPLAVARWARSPAAAAVSVGAGAVLAGAVLVRSRPSAPAAPGAGPRVRVASVSLRKGLVLPGPVLDLVRRHDVDVLSVQELTPEAERALVADGIGKLLPEAHVIPARPGTVPSASGAVWTRLPVLARSATPGTFEQPTVRLAVDGAPDLEVTAVHTEPPATSPGAVRRWNSDLAALPAPEDGVLRVLAGDFNATLDHAALRTVLRTGYVDAARQVGRALAWTWRPLRLRFPRLALDHVLLDPRIAVATVELVPLEGSDHRALVAHLVLPAR
ncbi:endonuclease/exonuclease/phosphatase family protein [Blastococcus sp. PRF04-17]|uniref:endonuclease/exonuclease/phosphatase family protein n=1 Tax=Blastococcus sp. PRF04-17 TaxID=2933797 RepID=UPI001FF48AFF|nr:endonuclease/exonuclease/phosphatase family protein [Blastococcus sp. PRF04-17]UOY00511.1 endonuclease/exonuclease/phosphatase family protein [Blastococcus sp. PRF04-17]